MNVPPTMSINTDNYRSILAVLRGKASLIAVSKTKSVEDIRAFYDLGHRDFGENYVQELLDKENLLPKDIRWHFIGHLQSNKVKYIAPFIHLIHGVDSVGLLKEINKQGVKNNRVIECLLQVHIATEETKFGFDAGELPELMPVFRDDALLKNVKIAGLMGMASFSDDKELVRSEFANLKKLFEATALPRTATCQLDVLSMGMSGDYTIALEEGSTMIRIGSLLFGERNQTG